MPKSIKKKPIVPQPPKQSTEGKEVYKWCEDLTNLFRQTDGCISDWVWQRLEAVGCKLSANDRSILLGVLKELRKGEE